jgi:polysaccharide pyruvyl transferase WcaK-like protein
MKGSKKSLKTLNIGLLDVCGVGSLGDEAIQQAMIQNIVKYCSDVEIYGFTCDPEDTQQRHGIKTFPINRVCGRDSWWLGDRPTSLTKKLFETFNKFEFLPNRILRKLGRISFGILLEILASIRAYRNLKGLDILIVSGGGQLDDDYLGVWYEPYILFFWGILAKLRNVKFAIVSVGVGNINASLSRFFIKTGLSLAFYRSYRDDKSKKYLENVLRFRKDDPIYPDLAHSLHLDRYHNLLTQNSPQTIAINPLYFIPGYWSGKDSSVYNDYLNKLACFMAWLIQNEYNIKMFSSCVGESSAIIEDLKIILRNNGIEFSEDRIINTSILTVDDLMSQMAMASMVVASRLHSVLLATLLNKPVIALSYHFKVDMLMKEMGQTEYCLRIDRFNVEELKEKFISLKANREAIETQLKQQTQRCRDTLDEQYKYLFQNLSF